MKTCTYCEYTKLNKCGIVKTIKGNGNLQYVKVPDDRCVHKEKDNKHDIS
jgi:hypothetical protein